MNRARFFAAAVVAIVAFSACASGEPPTVSPSLPPTASPSPPPTATPSPPPTVSPSPPPTATPSPPPAAATEPALPEIDLGRLYQVLELDEIEPIYEPVFETKGRTRLGDEQLVMGVAINGEAKAYPVSLMQVREMVNDEVGGTPVLVTW